MMFQLSFAVVLLALGQFATAQVVSPGACPKVDVMTTFDLGAYTGLWYEYAKYPVMFEDNNKCITAKYGDLGDSTVSVHNRGVRPTGESDEIDGYAKVLGPATLAVVFFEGASETEPNYTVLGTDYTTFAVVYSCSNLPLSHGEFLWILTRYNVPSEETIEAAKKIIDANGISQKHLVKTEQQDCAPVIDPDVKIVQ